MIHEILRLLSADGPFLPDEVAAVQLGRETAIRHHLWITAAVSVEAQRKRRLRVLEVGSWMGGSMLTWAAAVGTFAADGGEIFCIDTWAPYIPSDEVAGSGLYSVMDRAAASGLAYSVFCHNVKKAPAKVRVDHARGRSRDVLPLLRDNAFDIVYIDGSHQYADVLADVTEGRRIVCDGGLLCGDDLECQLSDVDAGFVRANAHRDTAIAPGTEKSFHPGVTLAVAEALGPVTDYTGFWATRRNGDRFEPVSLSGANVILPDHLKGDVRAVIVEWLEKSGHFQKQS